MYVFVCRCIDYECVTVQYISHLSFSYPFSDHSHHVISPSLSRPLCRALCNSCKPTPVASPTAHTISTPSASPPQKSPLPSALACRHSLQSMCLTFAKPLLTRGLAPLTTTRCVDVLCCAFYSYIASVTFLCVCIYIYICLYNMRVHCLFVSLAHSLSHSPQTLTYMCRRVRTGVGIMSLTWIVSSTTC